MYIKMLNNPLISYADVDYSRHEWDVGLSQAPFVSHMNAMSTYT
jgi:hypothetical protein